MRKSISPSGLLSTATIDLDNPLPYYQQLKEWLLDQLSRRQAEPGQQIPSEAEFCRAFGVSRTVVRQCLDDLVNEGLLYRRKGKGTFVAKPKIHRSLFQKLTSFYQDMVDHGFEPETHVVEQKLVRASKAIAEQLNLEAGSKVIRLVRLRSIEQEPLALSDTYLPYALCPGLLEEDFSHQSLYTLLEEKYGLEIARGRRAVEAIGANAEDARLLRCEMGSPLILLRGVCYLKNGCPVEYSESRHRGDRSQFDVELVRVRTGDNVLFQESSSFSLPKSNSVKLA